MAQTSSHLKAGLAAGAVLGLAAGLFLQSRKGKQLTKQAQKKAVQLQAQVMKKLKNIDMLDQKKYQEVVDHVLGYYLKTKEMAKVEIPEARKFLLGRWSEIQKQFKKVK